MEDLIILEKENIAPGIIEGIGRITIITNVGTAPNTIDN
jgi:hypothetical protein